MKPTPITSEIIRLEENKQNYQNKNFVDQSMVILIDSKKATLISLLPAEKEALIEAHVNGQAKMASSPHSHRLADANTWFSQTYTQDYKTK